MEKCKSETKVEMAGGRRRERDCFLPVDPGSGALRKSGYRREDMGQEGGVMSLPDPGLCRSTSGANTGVSSSTNAGELFGCVSGGF